MYALKYTVTCCLKGRIAEPKEAVIAVQQPGKLAPVGIDMRATTEEVVFSMLSVLRLYNEDHRRVSQHSAVSSLV
jgi:hypothetical protein